MSDYSRNVVVLEESEVSRQRSFDIDVIDCNKPRLADYDGAPTAVRPESDSSSSRILSMCVSRFS